MNSATPQMALGFSRCCAHISHISHWHNYGIVSTQICKHVNLMLGVRLWICNAPPTHTISLATKRGAEWRGHFLHQHSGIDFFIIFFILNFIIISLFSFLLFLLKYFFFILYSFSSLSTTSENNYRQWFHFINIRSYALRAACMMKCAYKYNNMRTHNYLYTHVYIHNYSILCYTSGIQCMQRHKCGMWSWNVMMWSRGMRCSRLV